MRMLIALLVVIYLIGVGVVLSPTIRANWSTDTTANAATDLAQALPYALAWPARAFQRATDRGTPDHT